MSNHYTSIVLKRVKDTEIRMVYATTGMRDPSGFTGFAIVKAAQGGWKLYSVPSYTGTVREIGHRVKLAINARPGSHVYNARECVEHFETQREAKAYFMGDAA